jgi:Helix-turn-helix of DDE superfamily endonuclease
MKITTILKSDRSMKALTWMSIKEFEILLVSFEKVLYEFFASKKRIRQVRGGRKGVHASVRSKMFYILFYLKVYPTFDLAGFIFGVDRAISLD